MLYSRIFTAPSTSSYKLKYFIHLKLNINLNHNYPATNSAFHPPQRIRNRNNDAHTVPYNSPFIIIYNLRKVLNGLLFYCSICIYSVRFAELVYAYNARLMVIKIYKRVQCVPFHSKMRIYTFKYNQTTCSK